MSTINYSIFYLAIYFYQIPTKRLITNEKKNHKKIIKSLNSSKTLPPNKSKEYKEIGFTYLILDKNNILFYIKISSCRLSRCVSLTIIY